MAPSKRWKKANGRVQKIHTDVRNAHKNLIHETTTRLAKDYDVIVLEDLNVAGMMKNHSLAKHVSDAAMGELSRQILYKAKWHDVEVRIAGRFFPSSKTCSGCGEVKVIFKLSERIYSCGACGLVIDRDVNAAINLARCQPAQPLSGTPPTPTCALLLSTA